MIIFMKIIQKLYQMFIIGTSGNNLESVIQKGLGGIIFFTDDIISTDDFKNKIKYFSKQSDTSLFFSIDQEGGRVERTQNIWNGKKYLSAKYAFQKGELFLKEQTQAISEELKSYGINLNFAPCCDVDTNPDNPIIGERAFANNAEDVIKGAETVIKTYRKNGIISCIKHFPGHGDTNCDSHLVLPEIDMPLYEMENLHIKPFKTLIKKDLADIVMVAHIHCKCFDEKVIPTSLSKNTINYLKTFYNGVICSDDMVMKALDNFENPCEMAIRAGVNMFIYRNCNDETINTIETIAKKAEFDTVLQKNIEESYEKIIELKRKYKIL